MKHSKAESHPDASKGGGTLPAWAPPALLALATLILCGPFTLGGQALYWGTPLLQFVPWRVAAEELWRAGAVPLWLQGVGNGAPLLANHQSALFYPLQVLFWHLPAERAFGWAAALHLFLAGLGLYALGRALRLSRQAALLGGLSYMLSGYLVTRLNFPSMTAAAAWLPWLLLAGERTVQRERLADVLALGVLIGTQLLAGHAQTSYYSLWLLAAFVLWRAADAGWRPAGRALLRLGSAGLLGIALAGVQVLPTAELALRSQRQAGAAYDFAMTYSFWPWRLITFLAPDFFGNPAHGDYWGYANYWEDAGYIGLLPLLLLAPAWRAWRGRRRDSGAALPAAALVPFLLLMAGLSLLLALGQRTPIYPLVFRHVPGFGLFQAPARLLLWATAALALLGAIGAEALPLTRGRGQAGRLLLVAGLGLGLAGGVAALALSQIKASFGPALLRTAGLLVAYGAVIVLSEATPGAGVRRLRAVWHPLLALLVLVDLLLFGDGFTPTTDPAIYRTPSRTAAWLHAHAGGQDFRIYTFDAAEYAIKFKSYLSFTSFDAGQTAQQIALRETLLPEVVLLDDIESAGHFDPLLEGHYKSLMDRINRMQPESALRLLGLMNVAYILQPDPLASLPAEDVGDLPTRIYRNPFVQPRAWLTPAARCLTNEEAVWDALSAPDFDPRRVVLLENCSESLASFSAAHADAPLDAIQTNGSAALRYHPNGVTIRATASAAGYLFLADTWYPGWKATVNGAPAPVLQANAAFRAVPVPAGANTIELRYAPASFAWGAGISILSALSTLAGILISAGRRRNLKKEPRAS